MSDAFTKLFEKILDSTVWGEDSDTRIVWITLLALANKDGHVLNTIPGLARRALPQEPDDVRIPKIEKALEIFKAPDPYSRTPDHEGRRIVDIQGGWFVLNHPLYRKQAQAELRAEQQRIASAHYRAKKGGSRKRSGNRETCVDASTPVIKTSSPTEAEGRSRRQKQGNSNTSSPPPPPDGEPGRSGNGDSVLPTQAARHQLWRLGWIRRWSDHYAQETAGLVPAEGPKAGEHLATLTRWSFASKLSDADCEQVLERFFEDRDPEVTGDEHWVGFLAARATRYLRGAGTGRARTGPAPAPSLDDWEGEDVSDDFDAIVGRRNA